MHENKSWLWPDRTIGKRESRRLRDEHNATVNDCADLLAALRRISECDHAHSCQTCNEVARASIAKAEGGAA